ncbi:OLC1v1033766C1 [Oldenlandia corymbosa var. corymbosa]|uniref:RING-type E3 ubiquitin transferase n=1 Tax=Oldenlandia corymbosa var. corymbosa TaxID=529605 RepID=A0AAV1CP12_OLDCO|nr:OLC1v1033766C1 [Oldenlandia corymbosa var. corymbosa]
MALNIFFVLVIFQLATIIQAGGNKQSTPEHDDPCAEQKCRPGGPAVRFPFVLQGKQPEYCGYNSSFHLRCDQLSRTILELPPSSIKVEVTYISYLSQMIKLQSVETCLPKHSRDLDLSLTPFFPRNEDTGASWAFEEFSLFNCSPRPWGLILIKCLGNNKSKVYAMSSREIIWYASLESCTKMYDTKTVSAEMFQTDLIILYWSLPLCRRCEVQGGICRWRTGQIGCLRVNKHHFGMKFVLF